MRRLTAHAHTLRDAFIKMFSGRKCECHLGFKCAYCTHPGNPENQKADLHWVEIPEPKSVVIADHVYSKKLRDW